MAWDRLMGQSSRQYAPGRTRIVMPNELKEQKQKARDLTRLWARCPRNLFLCIIACCNVLYCFYCFMILLPFTCLCFRWCYRVLIDLILYVVYCMFSFMDINTSRLIFRNQGFSNSTFLYFVSFYVSLMGIRSITNNPQNSQVLLLMYWTFNSDKISKISKIAKYRTRYSDVVFLNFWLW